MKYVLAAILCFIGMGLLRMQQFSLQESNRDSPIQMKVTQLEPKEMSQGYIVGSPNTRVRFVYELHNDSPRSVENLSAQLFCKYSLSKPFPKRLEPAEAVSVEFLVPVPGVGVRHEKLIVRGGPRSLPVAELPASVRSNVRPPLATAVPREILFTQVIDGEDIPVVHRTLVVTSIEVQGENPLFDHLIPDRPECFSARLTKQDEHKDPDPRFVRRVYNFTISSIPSGIREFFYSEPATRKTRALLVPLRFRGEAMAKLTHGEIVIRMDLFDPVSLLPNPVVLRRASAGDVAEGKVIIYNRTAKPLKKARVLPPVASNLQVSIIEESGTGQPRELFVQARDSNQLSTSITLVIDGKQYPLRLRVE